MVLDVFRCSQLFSNVFSWVVTFLDNQSPPVQTFFLKMMSYLFRRSQLFSDDPRIPSIDHRYSIEQKFSDVFKMCSDVLRCSKMFSDDHRYFWMFYICSQMFLDVLQMFLGSFQDISRLFTEYSQDVLRIFSGLRYESSTLILYKELSSPIFQSCQSVSESVRHR